ncbi:hypothetical protein Q5O14_18040 [Eubacteriaceae bacterium ES2]|nr:hypothetical protein Q5O14_18040 [Eubacteriaceae bacterium ES2]
MQIDDDIKNALVLLEKHIDRMVPQWNKVGIIYESNFCISSFMIEHSKDLIYEMIVKNGGYCADTLLGRGVFVENSGWMYAFFDADRVEHRDVEFLIKNHFKEDLGMLKKKEVKVKTIKHQDKELPILVKYFEKSYLIQEIKSQEDNYVFYEGGVGTKWTVVINKKETALYHDKHNLKWYVYVEGYDSPHEHQVRELVEITDTSYLN